jgi:hypothetical protein
MGSRSIRIRPYFRWWNRNNPIKKEIRMPYHKGKKKKKKMKKGKKK